MIDIRFEDAFAYVTITEEVDGHEVFMSATHFIDRDIVNDLDCYNVLFTINSEEDIRELNLTRSTKVAICKKLKVVWRELVATVIEQFGEECCFKCLAYTEDGNGDQRIVNYKKQGFELADDGFMYFTP